MRIDADPDLRNLMIFPKVKFDLLNTHLESTAEHATERKVQLRKCLDLIERLV
jgi:hypothetical protein